jgi:gliding motility-associated-like protein
MKKSIITISAFILGLNIQAQDNVTINSGLFSTRNGTQVSTGFDFINQSSGNLINDGEFHFYGDYKNDGLFSYSTNSTSGYVVFEGRNKAVQELSGASPSFFYDALFNKSGLEKSFHLTNAIENAGTVNLFDGVVLMDKDLGGSFVFLSGAQHINTSDKSHVDGEVTKIGKESFKYPIGNSGYYRYASISAPSNVASQYRGEYLYKNSDVNYPHRNKTAVINVIDDKEYWIINKSESTSGSIILTLSWDERTTPSHLIANGAEDLRIVRWDQEQSLWVDEGGIVDYANKTVTTPVDVLGFGIFTLASKNPIDEAGDVVIYNGVTPDGDGKNDYFIIDKIQRYPNNTVRIFNRWGVEVFKTTNYDSDGNVFNGYSKARATIDESSKLPTGTYYYILEYEYTNDSGSSQMIKKAGYLHLESND